MPPRPSWFLRIPEILDQLRTAGTPIIDRAAVEQLFRLRRRQAISLMRQFGGYQLGRTFLAETSDVVAWLEAAASGEAFAMEARRKARIAEMIETARQEMAARSITIPPPRPVAGLPAGVHLQKGELRIEFEGMEDLLRRLLELSQAIMQDFDRFRSLAD